MSDFDFDVLIAAAHDRAAKQGLKAGPAQQGFTALFGPVFSSGTDCYLFVDERHTNPEGFVHGGLLSAFVDYVFYVSALAQLPDNAVCPTIDLQLQYLAAARAGDTLTGKASVLRETRDLLFVRGEVLADDKLIVAASGVYKKIHHQP
ncbi:PaaI family thioesterase [Alteromonas lipolytica]|uniref:Thioesterase domain-containing protein n=1 Tax=Alteromonas lipolytica TaxID=1856405 RepID=A0A1E8FBV4_9ALTE|nr:PaaI family thioesterase [Alteromonas lipolytica]OFI33401.1 hypothetical protein BFC17_03825 [Alteromonas lipolytica]GGF60024.1 hypothetical protein GCM10011338_10370 [Alteromonas lipolytica]